MDKRVKKLPLMTLSTAMAESFKELDPESSLGKALEMGCCIQSSLAKIVAEFEIALEHNVLQPLNKLSEEELPIILKRKKTLQKLISDWNTIKSRLNQAAKSSNNSTGAGACPGASSAANKLEVLKEEEEEVKRKVEQCKDEYMADLYHFSTKEDIYASYFIQLLEIQAHYHRQSLESLDSALAELRESHRQTESSFTTDTPVAGYYGVSLETHLKNLGREIALPIEACVMMLLASGMKEEGLFRLAAGASVLKKLKSSLASGSNALEEFYSDPHAVAGALKSYLRELPQPLMTFELYDKWVKVASLKDVDSRMQSLQDTCSRLPQDSYNNLRYLIKFLAKLAEHQEVNKMTPSNIAIVLGPNLLWSQQSTGDPMQMDLASVSSIQAVVEALIQNADTLFPGGMARASLGGPNVASSPGGGKLDGALAPCYGLLWVANASSQHLLLSLHPEVDFNVSGMFMPPTNRGLCKAAPVEELTPTTSSPEALGVPVLPMSSLHATPHQDHTFTGGCKVPRGQDHHAQPKSDLPCSLCSTSRDPEARSQPASPALLRPSLEPAGPPAPTVTDDNTRKG
uniref:SH3 domain-binding protein 1 n=1 Tax=Malurus cyaneus samueli TaxID=2593467 RepID=A0A8C5U6N5_9PASS